jgi:hypothetical protein
MTIDPIRETAHIRETALNALGKINQTGTKLVSTAKTFGDPENNSQNQRIATILVERLGKIEDPTVNNILLASLIKVIEKNTPLTPGEFKKIVHEETQSSEKQEIQKSKMQELLKKVDDAAKSWGDELENVSTRPSMVKTIQQFGKKTP